MEADNLWQILESCGIGMYRFNHEHQNWWWFSIQFGLLTVVYVHLFYNYCD